jgi:hypothetical protein
MGSERSLAGRVARAFLHPLLVGLVTGLLFAWPAWAWNGELGLRMLAVAGGLAALGAALGQLAQVVLGRLLSGPSADLAAVQAGMGVRLLATAGMALPLFFTDAYPATPFTVWLGLHYLAQLVLEVFVSVRTLGQNPGPPARDGGNAA